jgi:hypothetical protein
MIEQNRPPENGSLRAPPRASCSRSRNYRPTIAIQPRILNGNNAVQNGHSAVAWEHCPVKPLGNYREKIFLFPTKTYAKDVEGAYLALTHLPLIPANDYLTLCE